MLPDCALTPKDCAICLAYSDVHFAVQALQYLRRLCSHPLLAVDQDNPVHTAAVLRITGADSWQAAQARLHALHHAPKLAALRDLLQQCGIVGDEGEPSAHAVTLDGADAPNRVLVFAQLRSLLDLVESDLLKPLGVPFLRLDGGCACCWALCDEIGCHSCCDAALGSLCTSITVLLRA